MTEEELLNERVSGLMFDVKVLQKELTELKQDMGLLRDAVKRMDSDVSRAKLDSWRYER